MRNTLSRGIILILSLLFLAGCSGDSGSINDYQSSAVTAPVSQPEQPVQPEYHPDTILGAVNGTSDKNLVVVISDLHLGDQRGIDGGYGWFIKNEALLTAFLQSLVTRPAVKELVIAGDMFDEWVAPMEYDALNNYGADQAGESKFVDSIAAAHPDVIHALNSIIASGMKVTYIPGNHDMLVTAADIDRIFPGIQQRRDAAGLGAYSPDGLPEVIIEHSHRYDFFNAPDMISNRIPTSPENYTTNPRALIPPGFFVSKIAASNGFQYPGLGQPDLTSNYQAGPFLYWTAWQLILAKIHVTQDHNAKIIKTGIDGYTGTYAINDLVPQVRFLTIQQPLLYQYIEDNWKNRQAQNLVNVPINVLSGLLVGSLNEWCNLQSSTQYFLHDTSKRIVVFGHTHEATMSSALNTKLEKCLYANSGTWIDKGDPDCTCVVINPAPQSDGTLKESVSVYQYTESQTLKELYTDSIIVNP